MSNGSDGPCRVALIIARRLGCELLDRVLRTFSFLRIIGAATDPTVGIALISQHRPQVVLVDATMPNGGALKCLEALATGDRLSRTIVLGDDIHPFQIQQALCLGAAGFFTQNDSIAEIADGIRAVAEGRFAFSRQVSDAITLTPRGPTLAPHIRAKQFESLTDREMDVLACLVNGDTVSDCARRLDLSASTIDNHKTRIMRKLKTHRMVDLVRIAIQKRLIADV
jgi:DNA-binding NarL/FixJ family response regulator